VTSRSDIDTALRDLRHARDDLSRNGFKNAQAGFGTLVEVFESEPLRGLIASLAIQFDFQKWWNAGDGSENSMHGQSQLTWPQNLAERVVAQIDFARRASAEQRYVIEYLYREIGVSGSIDRRFEQLLSRIVDPLIRDVEKLCELREASPVLSGVLHRDFTPTGDATFDELLDAAIQQFRDPTPATRKAGLEKLWDAWERLKSLEIPGDKKASADAILTSATTDSVFKELLSEEAKALTKIGNDYQIRHFETGKLELAEVGQVDYLFHRCFAMIWLLMSAIRKTNGE
jgi:hypothetical protein